MSPEMGDKRGRRRSAARLQTHGGIGTHAPERFLAGPVARRLLPAPHGNVFGECLKRGSKDLAQSAAIGAEGLAGWRFRVREDRWRRCAGGIRQITSSVPGGSVAK